jgi:hypothetical protein
MVQERSPFSLADLPISLLPDEFGEFHPSLQRAAVRMENRTLDSRGVDRSDLYPETLAAIGATLTPAHESFNGGGFPFAVASDFESSVPSSFGGGSFRTALLQGGLGISGNAAQSNPIIPIGDEIKPHRLDRPTQRHEPDREPGQLHRRWPPVQIDLPRFNAPEDAPQRMIDLFNKPGLKDRMMEAIGAGRTMMGDADWYDAKWLRDQFVEEFGHNAGTALFYDLIGFIAATSPGSDVGTNIRNATHYFNKFRRGEPLPEVGDRNPYPYGHWLSDIHQKLARAVAEETGLDPIRYPKITSFVQNLIGNYKPVTIDMHALRLPAMLARDANFLKHKYRKMLERGEISMDEAVAHPSYWRNPYPNEYAAIEAFYKELATRANLLPAEAQAAAWLGGGHITGLKSKAFKSFKEYFDDRIRRTAKKTGLSEDEVWRLFRRGELDLVLLSGQQIAAG